MSSEREEKKMDSAFAPYNFIPMLEGEAKQDVAARDEVPSFNDTPEGTLTGHIDYDLRALDNLHVGAETGGKNQKEKSYDTIHPFFQNGEGKYAIPGSTMRGFVRSHAELLSGSYPDSVTDDIFLYRKFASKCKTVRNEYSDRMKSEKRRENARKNQQKTGDQNALPSVMRVPDDVKAGYIVNHNGRYFIIPVQEFGDTGTTFFRVHEADLRKADKLSANQYMYNSQLTIGEEPDRRDHNDAYRPYRGVKTRFSYDRASHRLNLYGQDEEGILLNSGWIDKKTHHYLVSAAEKSGNGSVEIPLELSASYKADYERNCIQNKALKEEKDFYELPENGKKKLFFYKLIKIDGTEKLIGFGPTPYFRIYYDHRLRDGLLVKKGRGLDYAEAIFGYAGKEESLKSRVTFENCVVQTVPLTRTVSLTLAGPKLSSFPMYISQKREEDSDALLPASDLRTYNAESFKTNGYKFYWKRSRAIESMDEVEKSTRNQASGDKKNTKIESKLQAVHTTPENPVVFHGRIDFENLRPDELGLVLMSLRLQEETEPESYLIGRGKPYGMGRISPKNIHLFCMDQKERFLSVSPTETDCTDKIADYKKAFLSVMDKDYMESSMYKTYLAVIRQDNADSYLNQYDGKTAWSDADENRHVVYMPLDSKMAEVPDYKACLPLDSALKILNDSNNPMQEAVVTDIRDQGNGNGYCVTVRLPDGTEGVRCYQNKNTRDSEHAIGSIRVGSRVILRAEYKKAKKPGKPDRVLATEWWII